MIRGSYSLDRDPYSHRDGRLPPLFSVLLVFKISLVVNSRLHKLVIFALLLTIQFAVMSLYNVQFTVIKVHHSYILLHHALILVTDTDV